MAKKKQETSAPSLPPRRIRVTMKVVNPTGKPVPVAEAVQQFVTGGKIYVPTAQPSITIAPPRKAEDDDDEFDF